MIVKWVLLFNINPFCSLFFLSILLFCVPRHTIHLLLQLDVVGREQAGLALVVAEPPVLVRELNIRHLGTLGEAQFCFI